MLFHVSFQMRGSNEAFVANVTFVRPFIFANVGKVVLLPVPSIGHSLLFTADLTNDYKLHVWVGEILHILQAANYRR